MSFDFDKLKTQGIKVNYYYVCRRKLWMFSKGITMEQNSDRVLQGKALHENSYPRFKKKEVLIDDCLKLDILDGDFVREVKISSKMPEADRMQLGYYLYYLKNMGLEKRGIINYVKEKRQEIIELNPELEMELEIVLVEIDSLLKDEFPPRLKKLPYCTKCAYYEFCFAREGDFSGEQ